MLRRVLAAALALMCLMSISLALADRVYIIGDSDTRALTYGELWQWNRESVNYICNEILARHGYVFEAGGKYDNYFRAMPWYQPNANPNNREACYPQLSQVEWQNIRLCKKVMKDMVAQETTNPKGRWVLDVCDFPAGGLATLGGFEYCNLNGGQMLAVYAAPGEASWRGAAGKAAISTNGAPYAAGWDGDWLLVMYEIGSKTEKAMRVGYIQVTRDDGSAKDMPELTFENTQTTVISTCSLTDDPVYQHAVMREMEVGETVTYLTSFYGDAAWDYIETTVNGQKARGFIPSGSLRLSEDDIDDSEWPDGSNG